MLPPAILLFIRRKFKLFCSFPCPLDDVRVAFCERQIVRFLPEERFGSNVQHACTSSLFQLLEQVHEVPLFIQSLKELSPHGD